MSSSIRKKEVKNTLLPSATRMSIIGMTIVSSHSKNLWRSTNITLASFLYMSVRMFVPNASHALSESSTKSGTLLG